MVAALTPTLQNGRAKKKKKEKQAESLPSRTPLFYLIYHFLALPCHTNAIVLRVPLRHGLSPLPTPDGEGEGPNGGTWGNNTCHPAQSSGQVGKKKYYFISRCSPPLAPNSNAEPCLWSRACCTELAISSSNPALNIVTISGDEPGLAIGSADSHALSACDFLKKKSFPLFKPWDVIPTVPGR